MANTNTPKPMVTSSEEFQAYIKDVDGVFDPFNEFLESYRSVIRAAEKQLNILKGMKDDSDEKAESPTALARKEVVQVWESEVQGWFENSDILDTLFAYQGEYPESALAVAEYLEELADHFKFIGNLHAQDVRNQKYAGSSTGDTDEDAAAQREVVSALIENAKVMSNLAATMPDGEKAAKIEIPSLRGVTVGSSGSSGTRKSSRYPNPVLTHQIMFTVDGEELPAKTGLAHAVLNYLFPKLGAASFGMDIENSIIKALKSENPSWDRPGQETIIYFEASNGVAVAFEVNVLKVDE